MKFQRGDRIEVCKKSEDEAWESYMDDFVGIHGIITDPNTNINDPDVLIEVSLQGKGTHRLPQESLKLIEKL